MIAQGFRRRGAAQVLHQSPHALGTIREPVAVDQTCQIPIAFRPRSSCSAISSR
jgi:hypothetical protein